MERVYNITGLTDCHGACPLKNINLDAPCDLVGEMKLGSVSIPVGTETFAAANLMSVEVEKLRRKKRLSPCKRKENPIGGKPVKIFWKSAYISTPQ